MKARVVRIGNSRGLRIPKPLLEQTGLSGEVEIEAEGNRLVVRPARPPRTGWAEAFAAMTDSGDDRLVHGAPRPTRFDREDWTW